MMMVYHFVDAANGISNLALQRIKISRINQLNDPFEFLAADMQNPEHHNSFTNMKDELNEIFGIICFSSKWNNPLLWGHYAKKHTGIVLGFDIPNDCLGKVKYTNSRLKIKFDINNKVVGQRKTMKNLLLTKFKDWKYEDEYRSFHKLNDINKEGSNYFVNFSQNMNLREVIIGYKCDIPISRIMNLFRSDPKSINVLKARLDFNSFNVIK